MLNLVWVIPFIPLARAQVASAWKFAGIFIPISFGWAAGDVSLAAFIQSALARMESVDPDASALSELFCSAQEIDPKSTGAVMAFLYVTYILLYAVLSAVLGK
jgi:hypothetical protein